MAEGNTSLERYPSTWEFWSAMIMLRDSRLRTLVLSVTTLNFFMRALLHFTFQDPGSLWFVKTRHFEYLGRVEPRIFTSPHDGNSFAHPGEMLINIQNMNTIYWKTDISYTGMPL